MSTTLEWVRFIAVDGAKTARGATVQAKIMPDNGTIITGKKCILEGELVTYPNGETALVLKDDSVKLEKIIGEKRYFVAAEGTLLSNGDVISESGQDRFGLYKEKGMQPYLGIFDNEEREFIKKQRGL
jgi:hypothetical protein